jgi:hypothetical protein
VAAGQWATSAATSVGLLIVSLRFLIITDVWRTYSGFRFGVLKVQDYFTTMSRQDTLQAFMGPFFHFQFPLSAVFGYKPGSWRHFSTQTCISKMIDQKYDLHRTICPLRAI